MMVEDFFVGLPLAGTSDIQFFLKRQKEILSFLLNVWEIFYIFATENKSQTMTLGKAPCNLIQYLYL